MNLNDSFGKLFETLSPSPSEMEQAVCWGNIMTLLIFHPYLTLETVLALKTFVPFIKLIIYWRKKTIGGCGDHFLNSQLHFLSICLSFVYVHLHIIVSINLPFFWHLTVRSLHSSMLTQAIQMEMFPSQLTK